MSPYPMCLRSLALALPLLACIGSTGSPAPHGAGEASILDSLLQARRSTRSFQDSALTRSEVMSLLWAGNGLLTDGRRTVPSAGAAYPLRLLLVCGDVDGIAAGVYRYEPQDSSLAPVAGGDRRQELCESCLLQPWVREAPASIVIAADPAATIERYGERGNRYVYLEAGHSSQNIYLECAGLGLGTVAVGAFDDSLVAAVTGLLEAEIPIYVMPVGRIR